MANQLSNEGSSTRNIAGDGSDAIVELNVKTIDSQRYSFQVNLNMPVSAFKEKIATETGVPVGLQRLIFRGKVLKDEHLLSEYQLENGHTLHMVVRQSTQSQSAAETSSGDANANTANRGNDANAGTPQNRIGQISHSVVLGTLNVGDSGEAVVPDFSRVIGAVLNSLGLGGQTAVSGIGGMQPSTMPTVSGQTPQGNETAGALRTDGSGQGQTGNQTQTGQTFPAQQFHSLPQFMQMPMTAAVPLPSIHSPIPDSLSTLSGFMACLDQSLAEDEPNASPNSMRDTPRAELPPNVRGLQALSIVLRQAERLLGDRAVATLSHIAGRLEQEGASSDPSTRGQIQAESTYVGLAMQHLGALFLELGRTILTLQMAHPPAEASINPGPAVYISPSGPNPIMVQPFPLQTNSLFGGSAIQPNPVAVGVGNVPRNINIHIHAGTALAPVLSNVGTRTSNGEGVQGGQGNGIGSANSGPVRAIPLRNIIAVPSRATGVAVSSGAQPGIGVSVSQPPADSLVADINARIRGLLGTMQGDPPASGAVSSGAGNDARNERSNVMVDNGGGESTVNSSGLTSDGNGEKKHDEQHDQGSNGGTKDSVLSSKDVPPCSVGCSSKETSSKSEGTSENVPSSSEKHDASENVQTIPLGLGLGSLDRKKRTKQPKPLVDGTGSTPASQNLNSGTSSQQLLQSLASQISGANSSGVNDAGAGQISSSNGRNPEGGLLGQQNSAAGLDTAGMMSEMIQSPALNGLLAGVSEQTGVGSPNVLRDMLQQLTQNPQLMSTVGQIAQQVENQGIGNMFSGLAGGQGGGGLDLSRMMQQMMPVVSQVLGGGGSATRAFSPLESEPHQHYNEMGLEGNVNAQIDLEEVAQRIGQMNTPEDIFLAVAENAVRLNGSETEFDILNELSNNDDIINEYMEVLQHDINRRLESEHGQDK